MKFDFVGSLLEVMLKSVPTEDVVNNEYQKKPNSRFCSMPDDLRKAINEARKKKEGSKS